MHGAVAQECQNPSSIPHFVEEDVVKWCEMKNASSKVPRQVACCVPGFSTKPLPLPRRLYVVVISHNHFLMSFRDKVKSKPFFFAVKTKLNKTYFFHTTILPTVYFTQNLEEKSSGPKRNSFCNLVVVHFTIDEPCRPSQQKRNSETLVNVSFPHRLNQPALNWTKQKTPGLLNDVQCILATMIDWKNVVVAKNTLSLNFSIKTRQKPVCFLQFYFLLDSFKRLHVGYFLKCLKYQSSKFVLSREKMCNLYFFTGELYLGGLHNDSANDDSAIVKMAARF